MSVVPTLDQEVSLTLVRLETAGDVRVYVR
jgi:hypothetical protein